jgi:MFS superfamily sulfate permease-like transporter
MWALGWRQFLPFMITIVVILLTDLLIGVCIGLLLSIYFIIQNNFRVAYKVSHEINEGKEKYQIRLNSDVTFLNKVRLREALDRIPENSFLVIDGSHCHFIDYDILEIISEYRHKAIDRRIQLELTGITPVNVTAIH